MDQASSQLLRALRGKRSQRAFARAARFRANPVTDWEHGRRYPTTGETLRAAARVGKNVVAAFERFTPRVPLQLRAAGEFDIADWLTRLCGKTPVSELARGTGHSRSSIARWLAGKSDPRLPDFLQLVDVVTGRVPELVAELVPIAEVPALASRYESMCAAKRLALDEPWTEALLRLIEIDEHAARAAHKPGQFAARLGISSEDEKRCLDASMRAGIVQREGARYRTRPLSVDISGDPSALRRLRHHWSHVAGARALEPRQGDWLAYNVLSCNERDLARIRELLSATFREVRAIVASSEPSEVAALVNMQLIQW
jgi:transcriptional regulator with XRE-family HTH domain